MTTTPRRYGDACGIARALDLVGERWALLVARELVHGPKRFTDLRAGLPGVSADVLAQRLRDMKSAGIVRQRTLPPPAAVRVYELTAWGAQLEPVLLALGMFGSRAALPRRPSTLSVDAAVMMLQTTYRRPAAGEGERCGLVLDGDRFELETGPPALVARRCGADDPAATIITDPGTLAEVLFHGTDQDAAIAAGRLAIEGDAAAAQRLLTAFAPPAPAGA